MAEDIGFKELQEDIFDYFENVSDEIFVAVCDMLVFHLSADNADASRLVTQFLDDNGLSEAYINYYHELTKPKSSWHSSIIDVEMVEKVKRAFLAVSHVRMRKHFQKPKSPFYKLSKSEKKDLRMVIESCQSTNTDLLEDSNTERWFDEQEVKELTAERKRLKKLFPKVLQMLK